MWEKGKISKDKEIYAIITQVSVANAILAGIPGKLGIGVFVCIALEFYMALAIARRIGFKISEDYWLSYFPQDIVFFAFIDEQLDFFAETFKNMITIIKDLMNSY